MNSAKHTRGNKYLSHSSMWLFGLIFLIWPTADEQRKLTEEEKTRRDKTESVLRLSDSSIEVVSFRSELCRPVRRSADERESKGEIEKRKRGTCRIIRAWRIVLNYLTHSCMHTYAWVHASTHTFLLYTRSHTQTHTQTHTWKHAFIYSPNLRILGPYLHMYTG